MMVYQSGPSFYQENIILLMLFQTAKMELSETKNDQKWRLKLVVMHQNCYKECSFHQHQLRFWAPNMRLLLKIYGNAQRVKQNGMDAGLELI